MAVLKRVPFTNCCGAEIIYGFVGTNSYKGISKDELAKELVNLGAPTGSYSYNNLLKIAITNESQAMSAEVLAETPGWVEVVTFANPVHAGNPLKLWINYTEHRTNTKVVVEKSALEPQKAAAKRERKFDIPKKRQLESFPEYYTRLKEELIATFD